ncbi:MAG: hypothetical protein ACR2PG_10375, partial [Hyphomicrobiaceae bacterium]
RWSGHRTHCPKLCAVNSAHDTTVRPSFQANQGLMISRAAGLKTHRHVKAVQLVRSRRIVAGSLAILDMTKIPQPGSRNPFIVHQYVDS